MKEKVGKKEKEGLREEGEERGEEKEENNQLHKKHAVLPKSPL